MEKGHKTHVISGVYVGEKAEIKEPHPDFPGFYRCYIGHSEAHIAAQKENKAPQNVALLHRLQLAEASK
jgi:hypothetical protein